MIRTQVTTKQAVYVFELVKDQALVLKFVRKGQKGQDDACRCSRPMAARWYTQLLEQAVYTQHHYSTNVMELSM